jgi:hypothetical protein
VEREPFDKKYCQKVGCSKRHGNKCTIEGCVHSLKRIMYFETFGELPNNDPEIPERPLVEGK